MGFLYSNSQDAIDIEDMQGSFLEYYCPTQTITYDYRFIDITEKEKTILNKIIIP